MCEDAMLVEGSEVNHWWRREGGQERWVDEGGESGRRLSANLTLKPLYSQSEGTEQRERNMYQ
jgi:hypothetical protein